MCVCVCVCVCVCMYVCVCFCSIFQRSENDTANFYTPFAEVLPIYLYPCIS